jgi:catechol 2,3-dioxygenase
MSIASAISSATPQGRAYLRAVEERNHHSIVLTATEAPRAARHRLQARQRRGPQTAPRFYFARKGLPTSFPEVPYQGRTLRTVDPLGMPLDFYVRMDQSKGMIRNYAIPRALSSASTTSTASRRTCRRRTIFSSDIGFRLTEYTETDDRTRNCGRCGCTTKGNVHDSPSPTAPARACTISAFGRRPRSTSCTSAT